MWVDTVTVMCGWVDTVTAMWVGGDSLMPDVLQFVRGGHIIS